MQAESTGSEMRAAAEAGDAEAQFWLGARFAGADAPDPVAAHFWCAAAAAQGHVLAQANLGAMLLSGYGTAKDEAAAARWLAEAAAGEDMVAQFEFANLLYRGLGVAQDQVAAAQWYRRAAASGHYPAQARLGYLYANGIGVAKDRVEAFLWLSLAARHGIGTALQALEEVGQKMSVDEKRDGARRLANWRGTRPARVTLNPVLA